MKEPTHTMEYVERYSKDWEKAWDLLEAAFERGFCHVSPAGGYYMLMYKKGKQFYFKHSETREYVVV